MKAVYVARPNSLEIKEMPMHEAGKGFASTGTSSRR
jgi:hypothetical protein